jgi:iron complex transport system substrate-binding protein
MRTHVISSRFALISLLVCLLLSACGGQSVSPTASTTPSPTAAPVNDYYGTPVTIPKQAPQRIVSLTPAVSEILGALNLQNRVVGVDAFTDYPATLTSKPKVSDASGGFNVESIVGLQPDLVLSDAGFSKSVIAKLREVHLNVVDLPAANLQQTLDQIGTIGRLTSTEAAATQVVNQMQQQISEVQAKVAGSSAPSVLLLVDYAHSPGKPYAYGGGSFGDELLVKANAANIFHDDTSSGGYPQVTDEAIIAKKPQFVILTELPAYGGYKPDDVYKLAAWSGVDAVKNHHVYYVNSNIIQRPGPRLSQALRCLAQEVHPDKFSEALPGYCTATA